MTIPPNLFNYATSELSQDAAIMWLLEWAKPIHKDRNFKLHQLGLSLLKSFYNLHSVSLSDFEDIEIQPQVKKIDILVLVIHGDYKTAILIEDKIKSSNHSNQLKRYLEYLNSKNEYDLVIPVYFKTGFQASLERVTETGYHHYSIEKFHEILKEGKESGIQNDIFIDLFEHFDGLHKNFLGSKKSFENYAQKNVDDWTWWSWNGFFNNFQNSFINPDEGWGVVPSRRGNLLASWFGHEEFIYEKNGEKMLFKSFIDVRYEKLTNNYILSYRLHLNNNTQHHKEARNHIKKELIPRLKDSGLGIQESKFRKAKDTIEILKIQAEELNQESELLKTLDTLKTILADSVEAAK